MELYLIFQDSNDKWDYYESAVVAAPSEKVARHMDPSSGKRMKKENWTETYNLWCSSPSLVTVKHIGNAVRGTKRGVVCSSFNAG